MPERKNKRTFRVESDAVQGEGSFVVFKRLTWEEYKALPDGITAGDAAALAVVEWNWVDDAGKPLPLPSEQPEIIGQLMQEEIQFLAVSRNAGRLADEKN